ncbi:hypothetical protein CHL67_10045 [Prosthecochloris sp. GSB1]|uniref:DUF5683 domain-containing protein n=1 Tax=Prosthecochloris sp. GSB1 TaxID=281093 RepID=UPI000B8C7637|nr:DUF5683 domain-containing protein [Prosthecochloris sp. GSB1]ASQ91206.1 hypothetical protein CHL67_10045 [Prosthecochloris sp. GSB1]
MTKSTAAAALLLSALFFATQASPVQASETVFPANRATARSIEGALFVEASPEERERQAAEADGRMEPWKVAMISAVLPGYGQVYNGAVWKVPVLYGLLGYFGYRALDYNDSYKEYRDKYSADPDGPDASSYRSERDDYQEKRNQHIMFLALAYIAGIIDAYVDAHLYDFDAITDEGISGAASPSSIHHPSVSVNLKF